MGRYYSGDIEGKFWFGVQSSDDASFFGGVECEPSEIDFYFIKEADGKKIQSGLAKCDKVLGKYGKLIEEFFKKNDMYNDEQLAKALKVNKEKLRKLLTWYARQELGLKIWECVKKEGGCSFSAEL